MDYSICQQILGGLAVLVVLGGLLGIVGIALERKNVEGSDSSVPGKEDR